MASPLELLPASVFALLFFEDEWEERDEGKKQVFHEHHLGVSALHIAGLLSGTSKDGLPPRHMFVSCPWVQQAKGH